jgi:hypothetical protein
LKQGGFGDSEMADHRVRLAALNNARWCDAVCRAHGRAGEFVESGGVWINRQVVPRFYPNAVTISPDASTASIDELLCIGTLGQFAVKDSFCPLDLSSRGFRILFEEQWIYRPAAQPKPIVEITDVRWAKIDNAISLAAWESAWSGASEEKQKRIFLPPILDDGDVAFLAAYRGERIVAGGIANRTGEVVGMSNVFFPEANSSEFTAGCVAAIVDAFPGLPIVGYEGGPALAAARHIGFEAVGPLRVWSR